MQNSLHTLKAKLQQSSNRILSAQHLSDTPTRHGPVQRKEYYGGDPCNTFHALRQFLLNQGIDTRLFTFGTIALPKTFADPINLQNQGSIDNSFYFEFHKIITPESDVDLKVNVLVLLVRCFFESNQDNTTFHIQLVLNHHKDAIFELNQVYDDLIEIAQKDKWDEPSRDEPRRKVTFFEKKYTDSHDFKKFMRVLLKTFERHQVYGHSLLPAAPAF
jgi:hypothetical protein